MAGYLDLVNAGHLMKAAEDDAYGFRSMFPKLMKKLIDATCGNGASLRIPDSDVSSEPGYDGIVENSTKNSFVTEGLSVWEFGTDKGVRNKIEADYDKRTRKSLGVNKKDTTLYLCTPRRWPTKSISIEEWKNNHTDWKDVKIFDAHIISDWLNKTPSVCAWFLEQFTDNKNLKITSLDLAWRELVERTEPVLDEAFFDFGKEIDLKADGNEVVNICAENSIDAYGFALRFLKTTQKNNVIIAKDVAVVNEVQDIASGQIIVCLSKVGGAVSARNNNRIIVCGDLSCKTNDSLVLPKRDFGRTNSALIKAGMDASRASYICRTTHLKTRAIIRKIKNDAFEEMYSWRNTEQYDQIMKSMLCIQKCISEVDEKALSKISGLREEELENKLDALAIIDDSPIVKEGKVYILAAPEEVACAFIKDCDSVYVIRAKEVFLGILDAVLNKEKWQECDYYKCDNLLAGLATFFVYLSVYIDQNEHHKLNRLVWDILRHDAILKNGMVQEKVLPRFCEAASDCLMGFFENNPDKIIDGTISKKAYRLSIELLLESEYAKRACLLLKDIYYSTKDEDLLKILCMTLHPLKNNSALDLGSKIEIATGMIRDGGSCILQILEQFFETDMYYIADRIIEKCESEQKITITYAEYFNYYESIIEAVNGTTDVENLVTTAMTILNNLDCFSFDFLNRIKESYDYSKFTYEQLAELQLKLVEQKGFYEGRNNNRAKLLAEWLKNTAYDPALDKLWLFGSYYHYVNYHFGDSETFEEKEAEIKKERNIFLDKIRKQIPNNYIRILASVIKDEYFWGIYISQIDAGGIEGWTTALIEEEKAMALSGVLDAVNKEKKESLLKKIGTEMRMKVIPYMQNSDICEFLSQEEKESFWKTKEMREFSEDNYQNILQYNPEGLLPYLLVDKNAPLERAIEILNAISRAVFRNKEESRSCSNDDYVYAQIFDRYSKNSSERLDEAIFNLFVNGVVRYCPEQACRYVFGRIERIEDVVAKRDKFMINNLFGLRVPSELCADRTKIESIWNDIKKINNGDGILVAIIVNTIYLEHDVNSRRELLRVVENRADREILDRLKEGLEMQIVNGYYYNMSRVDMDINELLSTCNCLSNIKEVIERAINDNDVHEREFSDFCKKEELVRDRMKI